MLNAIQMIPMKSIGGNMTEYTYHPSGFLFPVENQKPTHEITPRNLPADWPGILSDPNKRTAADAYLQGMYRALSLHTSGANGFQLPGGPPNLKKTFCQFADYLLGKWYFDGEEMC